MVEHTKGGISVDWDKIKAEYISGGTSYRKLAEKYGVSESKVKRIARREKWTDLANQARTETDQKIVKKTAENKSESAVLISKTTEALLRKMAEDVTKDRLTSAQAELYKSAADALRKFKDVAGVKNPRDIEEQEARILNLRRQAEAGTTKDNKIVIELGEFKRFAE